MSELSDEQRTGRLAIFAIMIVILAAFLYAYKAESCKPVPTPCKDEFHEIKSDLRTYSYTCESGAVAEFVNSPPAPRPGILCHCATPSGSDLPK